MIDPSDPFDLARFVQAQASDYPRALAELRAGRKRTHWMWYVFPQFRGLGSSPMAEMYAIDSRAEARAYLAHRVLGRRLVECANVLLAGDGCDASEIFDTPDDLKLRSCATLFAAEMPAGSVMEQLLEKFFQGERDALTLRLIGPDGAA